MATQAPRVMRQHLALASRHAAKQSQGVNGSRTTGKIHSLRTFHKYVDSVKLAGEWAREHAGLRHLDALTPTMAQQYLEERAAGGLSQKQLDADRNALEFITGRASLERVFSINTPAPQSRAYTPAQVQAIGGRQNARNALATELAYRSGLRAHELLTLQRSDESRASDHRQWCTDRFQGREGVRYVVTGKGGLRREVLLGRDIAARLEARRLDTPREVRDRGIVYRQLYDISGGNTWSKSFADASERALGWSNGAHGLRHSYAQERMAELQDNGKRYAQAREVLSQELGHFRADVVETYLR
jgi:integrase